ncbi:MAG TPA: secretion system protein [Chloroflexi bacterium]|nr:secretion system protein [Chloroflexota bacterium]
MEGLIATLLTALGVLAPVVLCILPALLVGGVIFLIVRRRNRSGAGDLDRLDQFLESEWRPGPADTAAAQETTGKSTREAMAERLDNLLARRGIAGNIRSQLRKADLKLTVSEYLLMHLVMAFLLGGVGYLIRGVAIGGIGFVVGLFLPRIYVSIRQKRRLNAFNEQLPDILNLWVNSLRAGFSVPQAMETVAREAPSPASDEFKRVVAEIAIGIPIEVALNNMLARIESEDLDLVFTAVNIQREVGGNLAEILETISHTIRERIRIKGEIRTLTASGRATGTLVGSLPFGIAIFLYIVRPQYMGALFFGPERGGAYIPGIPIPCGWPIIALGLTLMAIGLAVIRRITDIEV